MAEPKVRFNGFEGDWDKSKLGKLTFFAGVKNKENLPLEPYSITNVHGFIPQDEAHDEFGYMQNTDRTAYIIVTPFSFGYNPARINVGSLGYYSGEENVIVSSLYEVFKTTKEVDDKFLMQWLQTDVFKKWIFRLQEGSVRQYFYYDKLCEVPLNYPSINEQQKIADFLFSVDKVISASEEEVANLETQKKAVMKKIFSQEVRFKREDGSDFPEWEEKSIANLGEIIGGGTPKTSIEEYWEGDTPWISSADLEENNIHVVNITRYITGDAINNSATKRVPEDSILIITRVGVGKVAVTPCELCTSQDYMSVVPYEGNTIFLGYAISKMMQDKTANVQGTSIKGIPSDEIKAYTIGIPSLEEQRLIADFLSDFDEAIAAAKRELELWKEMKKGLLQQMFV